MTADPYYMCEVHDPRDDNRLIPNHEAHNLDMAKVNVEMMHMDMSGDWEVQLDKLAKVYDMNYRDEVNICRETMPNFDEKLKIFFEEHLHRDPEVRLVKEGSGFFDVRSADDKWIRIPVKAGDFLYLPAGIYHRFTTDWNESIVAIRLFHSNPKWQAFNRAEDGDEQQERREFLLSNGLIQKRDL